jgi:hypothetical protein
MLRTFEATIDKDGKVRLQQKIQLQESRRAIVTILDEPAYLIVETAMLGEAAPGEGWDRPEEDKAWAHLQPAK